MKAITNWPQPLFLTVFRSFPLTLFKDRPVKDFKDRPVKVSLWQDSFFVSINSYF